MHVYKKDTFYNQTDGKIKTALDLYYLQTTMSSKHTIPTSTFIDEFPDHLSHLLCQTDNPIIIGDINIPWNKTGHLSTMSLN